jgi:hypothetical protein
MLYYPVYEEAFLQAEPRSKKMCGNISRITSNRIRSEHLLHGGGARVEVAGGEEEEKEADGTDFVLQRPFRSD